MVVDTLLAYHYNMQLRHTSCLVLFVFVITHSSKRNLPSCFESSSRAMELIRRLLTSLAQSVGQQYTTAIVASAKAAPTPEVLAIVIDHP